MSDGSGSAERSYLALERALAAAREEVAEKEALIAAWNEIINAMGERCKAAERARDEAVAARDAWNLAWQSRNFDAAKAERERDEAVAALRELVNKVTTYWKLDDTQGVVDRARRVLDGKGEPK